jgi:hypothetical protein
MKIDLYTKTVLTVIAACLLVLCVRPFLQPTTVSAQAPTRVTIMGIDATNPQLRKGIPVDLFGLEAKSLPVSVVGTNPVPVNITYVGGEAVGKQGLPVVSSSAKQ